MKFTVRPEESGGKRKVRFTTIHADTAMRHILVHAAVRGGCKGVTIYWKAFITRFVSDNLKSRKFPKSSQNRVTIDAHRVFYKIEHWYISITSNFILLGVYVENIRPCSLHINTSAWVSCVARSTGLGNARASNCGTGNMIRLLRFFFNSFQPCYLFLKAENSGVDRRINLNGR